MSDNTRHIIKANVFVVDLKLHVISILFTTVDYTKHLNFHFFFKWKNEFKNFYFQFFGKLKNEFVKFSFNFFSKRNRKIFIFHFYEKMKNEF